MNRTIAKRPGIHPLAIAGGILVVFCVAGNATGEQVYKYVSPDGSVTFSDTPPANADDYEEIQLPNYPAIDPEGHRKTLEQMAETSDRLQSARLLRQEKRERQTPTQPPLVIYQPADDNQDYRHPYWYYRDRFRNHNDRPKPPYRLDRDKPSTTEQRLKDNLRSPITIPAFGD
jgi:Domain of unknown function (DUF4124)